jgi:PAS domain S-box-containing protein
LIGIVSRILSSSRSLLVLSLVLLGAFGAFFYAQSQVKVTSDKLNELTINAERILTADLRSTTAVRLAASLQSDRYILNYQDFQDAKYDLLARISRQKKSEKLRRAFSAMENIQAEIEDAEAEAISLIDEEKWADALDLVIESSFRRQKGIYRANLSSALREMILDGEAQASQARRLTLIAQYGVLGTIVFLALIGILYSRNTRQALERQLELAHNLEDANKNLDQRVQDRTAELNASRTMFKSVLDNMPAVVFLKDRDGTFQLINSRYEEIYDVRLDDMVGQKLHDIFPAELADELSAIERGAVEKGLVVETEHTKVLNDEDLTLASVIFPITGPDGEISAYGGVELDITARKQAERDLMKARDAAEEATRAKASFLATMSHEIRTPMGGVIGMVDILGETRMDEDQQQMLRTVKESAQALLTIINDILDFSKIEAGKLDIEEIPVSIKEVVEGVSEALAVNARNKQIDLCVYVDPDLPEAVLGDQVRLRQILFNLGGNAIKFTERGKVLIRADKLGEVVDGQIQVRLRVIDDGIGIPEAAQAGLFQAFSQVDDSTTRRFGGTGLGLSICQRLTGLMGGEISVTSVEGEGSAFSVNLNLPVTEAEHSVKEEDLNGLNVLLALGDDDLGELIPRYLQHNNASTRAVGDIDEIADVLNKASDEQQVDVVVMGPRWTFDDKIEMVRKLRENPDFERIGFVIACRGRSKQKRKNHSEAVYVDADPMQRAAFVRSVAVAAGRASPDLDYGSEVEAPVKRRKVPSIEEADAQGQLILLAEDNLTNQDVIRRQLALLGYAVEIANDGVEALILHKSRHYAMLLTDCHMPNMDGFALTRSIREEEQETGRRLPIVAITASVMKEDVDSCFAADMDDYLSKPLDMARLRERLEKWMPEREAEADEEIFVVSSMDVPATETPASSDDVTGDASPIDPSALKSVFGDDEETFLEILMEFVDPATANVAEICSAVENRSAPEVGAAAHKLKSSSRSVGANQLADLCAQLEAAGKSGDWSTIDASVGQLPDILKDAVGYIEGLQG